MPSSAREKKPAALLCARFHASRAHSSPHSFPTRRSSDLFLREHELERALDAGEGAAEVVDDLGGEVGFGLLGFALVGDVFEGQGDGRPFLVIEDRKSTRLNSSHLVISYAVFCSRKKTCCTPLRPIPCLPRALVPTLFPYTTLFRSLPARARTRACPGCRRGGRGGRGRSGR